MKVLLVKRKRVIWNDLELLFIIMICVLFYQCDQYVFYDINVFYLFDPCMPGRTKLNLNI